MDVSAIVAIGALIVAVITLIGTADFSRFSAAFNFIRGDFGEAEVVVGVVIKGKNVLLIHAIPSKKSKLFWQFPSAHIRTGADSRKRIIQEIKSETDITCDVFSDLGKRRHPFNGKICQYYLCHYKNGEPQNLDPAENIYCRWVEAASVEEYIPRGLYKNIRKELVKLSNDTTI